MDYDENSFYYSKKDNLLVTQIRLYSFDEGKIYYTIANEMDSELRDSHDTIEYFEKNFKRVGWVINDETQNH
jgi:hypothetical protein